MRGAQIASRIDAAASLDHAQALAVGDKLRRCADLANVWHGDGLHNSDGDVYEGTGALWSCNERLCPSCLASRSRKSRARARAAILRPAMRDDYLWRFVTLTMPTLPGIPVLVALDVAASAWRLFSGKRENQGGAYEWWSDRVCAGVKGIEFTLGDERCAQHKRLKKSKKSLECKECVECKGFKWLPDVNGYHVHIHLLVLSQWIEWWSLRKKWTACLKVSLAEHGIEQGINTRDGLAVCDVRLVVNKEGGAKSTITGEGAINEVAKYVTKSESWLSVPDAQLVEIASIERWPRMFELLGECREQRTPARIAADKERRLARESEKQWCAELEETRKNISVDERLEALESGAEVKTEKRWSVERGELVESDVEVINDVQLLQDARAELRILWELLPATRAALEARTAYLDTQNLSALKNARDGTVFQRKRRAKSLRERGRELIERGEREKWREELAVHVAEVQSYRRSQQTWRYPYAEFSDLSGGRWYGLRANPASASV